MRHATFSLLLGISLFGARSTVAASLPTPAWLKAVPCAEKIVDQWARWGVSGEWTRAASAAEAPVFRSPTAVLGAWVETRLETGGGAEIRRVRLLRTTRLRWEGKRCRPELSVEDHQVDPGRLRGEFTDAYLESLLGAHRTGVIYAWSPHMGYSLAGMTAIRAAAAKVGVPLFLALDSQADPSLARSIARQRGLKTDETRRIQSLELLYRGMLNHFPSFVVFRDGRITHGTYFGLKSEGDYVRIIRKAVN